MRTLQRYLTGSLIWTTSLALLVLLGIFFFLSLIDQLEDAGQGRYGAPQAVIYVLLTVPRLVYELMPIAAMIGAMAALGILAQSGELNVIRTSGVSTFSLATMMGRSAVVVVLFTLCVGELVAPVSERRAQHQRSIALTEQITLQTQYGFWARDGNSFINIRKVLPGDKVEGIYIYEFDDKARLRYSIFARSAEYVNNRWVLEDIEQTIIDGDEVKREAHKKASWGSLLNPEMVNLVVIRPQYLSLWGLYSYIQFLKLNSQSAARYEQALYAKLIKPFTIIAMVILAIPLVSGPGRVMTTGQHVFSGALIGVMFHFCNLTSSHMGMVYNIHPSVSVTAPTFILMMILYALLRVRP